MKYTWVLFQNKGLFPEFQTNCTSQSSGANIYIGSVLAKTLRWNFIHLTRYCFVIALLLTKSIIALILARVSLTRMKKYQPGLLLPRTKILFSIIALEYPEGPRKNREIRNAVLKSRRYERAHKNATLWNF